jgi:hypothetical protein
VTAENHKIRLPEAHEDLLRSTALASVATLGPKGEHGKFSQTRTPQNYRNINREPRLAVSIVDPEVPSRYLEYQNHRPGDEPILVRPEHTAKMGS